MKIKRYLNNQNWNIGFSSITPEQLLHKKVLSKIYWLKHNYKDRFFADPFILDANESTIEVLVEEYIFNEGSKGSIVKLKIDRKTFRLLDRKEILKLDTHLSYPFIERIDNKIYVYPENSESSKWSKYQYDEKKELLQQQEVIINAPLTDATILKLDSKTYLVSTHYPKSQQDAFLYKYDESEKEFKLLHHKPIAGGKEGARMGGCFFKIGEKIYRPAQNCEKGYGKSLTIYEVVDIEPEYREKPVFRLEPKSWRYNLGLHTLNFDEKSELAVIDSYGYLYPVIGRIMMVAYRLKKIICG